MPSIEEVQEKLEKAIEDYKTLEQVGIPDSVKQAAKEQWKLNQDVLTLKAIQHYPESERKADAQRVIPLDAVLRTIREMEEEVINKTVLDPVDIYFRTVANREKQIVFILNGLTDWRIWWEVVKLLFQVITQGEAGLVKVLLHVFEIGAVATIAIVVEKILKLRESSAKKLRARAFPSPPAKRFRRRKVTRK